MAKAKPTGHLASVEKVEDAIHRPIQTHSSVSMINHHTTSNSVLTPYGSMSNSLVVIPAGLPAAAGCRHTVFYRDKKVLFKVKPKP